MIGREAVQRQKRPRPEVTVEDPAVRRRPQTVLANGEADAVRMVGVRLPGDSRRCQSGPGVSNGNPVPRGVGWCVGGDRSLEVEMAGCFGRFQLRTLSQVATTSRVVDRCASGPWLS